MYEPYSAQPGVHLTGRLVTSLSYTMLQAYGGRQTGRSGLKLSGGNVSRYPGPKIWPGMWTDEGRVHQDPQPHAGATQARIGFASGIFTTSLAPRKQMENKNGYQYCLYSSQQRAYSECSEPRILGDTLAEYWASVRLWVLTNTNPHRSTSQAKFWGPDSRNVATT